MRIREKKHKTINRFERLEVFNYALSPAVAPTVGLFWILISIVSFVTAVGVIPAAGPLAYTTCVLFFQYSFVVTEYTSRGHQEVPKISGNLVKPSADSRITKMMVLTTLFVSLCAVSYQYYPAISYLFGLYVFPAALSVLIIKRELIPALNPIEWAHVITSIKLDQRIIQFTLLQVTLILVLLLTFLSFNPLTEMIFSTWIAHEVAIFASIGLLLTYFRLIGVILHSNAEALELPVMLSEETEQRDEEEAAEKERQAFITRVYTEARGRRIKSAFSMLTDRMEAENYQHEAHYFSSVSKWDKPKLTTAMATGYIERLIRAKNYTIALNVLDTALECDDQFVLASGDSVMLLTERADTQQRRRNALNLLSRFPENYPKHPRRAESLLSACRIAAMDLNDFDWAKDKLTFLEAEFPEIHEHPKFAPLKSIVFEH